MLVTSLALITLWAFFFLFAAWLLRLEKTGTGAEADAAVDRIDRLLPQLQCALCGYPGCRPYAQALLAGSASIDQCPPGGVELAGQLRQLLGQEQVAAPQHFATEQVAVIDEQLCIGCFRCVQSCPVDAIIGAPQFIHTVLSAECTGCRLCLPVCPVDCIQMLNR